MMIDEDGLGIGAALHVRRRIPAVAQRHAALFDLHQHIAGEHLGDQAALAILLHHAVRVDAHAAAVLTAVLKGVQRMVGLRHDALALSAVDAEHAALILGLVQLLVQFLRIKPKLVFHIYFLLLFTE